MWTTQVESLDRGKTRKYIIETVDRSLTFTDVLALWRENAEFRTYFTQLIVAAPYQALRWETPGVSADTLTRPFEFVLIDAPNLDRRPDSKTFSDYFSVTEDVVEFTSLGKDARLIVPSPRGPAVNYVHLASFLRNAPADQVDQLWQSTARALEHRLGSKPCWLSTAGGGVAWLHVRIDDRPKYYWHGPYREFHA